MTSWGNDQINPKVGATYIDSGLNKSASKYILGTSEKNLNKDLVLDYIRELFQIWLLWQWHDIVRKYLYSLKTQVFINEMSWCL